MTTLILVICGVYVTIGIIKFFQGPDSWHDERRAREWERMRDPHGFSEHRAWQARRESELNDTDLFRFL